MSNISISLTANTSAYVKRIKDAKTETDRNVIRMEQRIDQFAQDVNKNFTSVGGAIDTMLGGLRMMKGGGIVAGVLGVGYAAGTVATQLKDLATQTVQAQNVLKLAADQARMSAHELQVMSMVTSTAGISLEKFGDMSKDIFDKLGDYVTTGAGAWVDFFDVMGDQVKVTAQELQKMTGPEVMMKVVEEMERAGASGSQMTFVLESIASDTSHLLPLLRNGAAGFKEMQKRMEEISRTPLLLADATREVAVMDAAWTGMWDSFGVMMTEQFTDLHKFIADASIKIKKMFDDETLDMQADKMLGKLKDGSFKLDVSKDLEVLRQERIAIGKTLAKLNDNADFAVKDTSITSAKNKAVNDLEKHGKVWTSYTQGNKTAWEAKKVELEKAAAEAQAKYNEAVKEFKTDALKKHTDLGKIIKDKEYLNKAGGGTQKEALDRIEKVDNGIEKDDIDKERKLAIDKEKQFRDELIQMELAFAEEKAKINENDKSEAADMARQKLKVMKNEIDEKTKLAEAYQKKQENLDKAEKKLKDASTKESAQKTKETINEERARLQASVTYAELGVEKLKAQYNLDVFNLKDALNNKTITQEQYDIAKLNMDVKHNQAVMSANVDAEIKKLSTQRQFATTEKEQRAIAHESQLLELSKAKNAGLVTEEEFFNKQAQLQREFDERERTAKMENWLENETIEVMNAQLEMERLQEQYDTQLITEEEFSKQRIEIEKRVADAKRIFATAQLDTLADTFGQMASMSEEGSKRQKTALIAQQAATMASMTMNQWQAWSNIDAPDSPYKSPIAANIAKAAVIAQYAAGMANVGAALGQFHSGTDEVDQTGSYILKKGERVVQETANKDLTAFLEGNGKSSGEMIVNADMIIQGDANIDENKFKAMLVQHRENITQAVKLAQRENPSLR